jgi:hypothetical protein
VEKTELLIKNTSKTENIEPKNGVILIHSGKNSPAICAPAHFGAWYIEPFQNGVPKPINKSFAKYPRKILPKERTLSEKAMRGVNSCAFTR